MGSGELNLKLIVWPFSFFITKSIILYSYFINVTFHLVATLHIYFKVMPEQMHVMP